MFTQYGDAPVWSVVPCTDAGVRVSHAACGGPLGRACTETTVAARKIAKQAFIAAKSALKCSLLRRLRACRQNLPYKRACAINKYGKTTPFPGTARLRYELSGPCLYIYQNIIVIPNI